MRNIGEVLNGCPAFLMHYLCGSFVDTLVLDLTESAGKHCLLRPKHTIIMCFALYSGPLGFNDGASWDDASKGEKIINTTVL